MPSVNFAVLGALFKHYLTLQSFLKLKHFGGSTLYPNLSVTIRICLS